MRDICGILGVNRSSFYYQPKEDPSEEGLRAETEKLAAEYPTDGYRRITQLLRCQGYTVGTPGASLGFCNDYENQSCEL